MLGSSVAELAKETNIAARTVKSVLTVAKIEPVMIAGFKRKIEYFEKEAAIAAINAHKAAELEAKTVSKAVPEAVGDLAPGTVAKLLKQINQHVSSEGDRLSKSMLLMLDTFKERELSHGAHNEKIKEYVKSTLTKLSELEATNSKSGKDHSTKLGTLRTDVEQALSAVKQELHILNKETARSHDDFKIRLEMVEHTVSETNDMVKMIHAAIMSGDVLSTIMHADPKVKEDPVVKVPADTPVTSVADAPIIGLVGFLDRQAAEIISRLGDRAIVRYITSQARNPGVAQLVKCEKTWLASAFVSHSLQEKLNKNRVNYELVPNGAMTGVLRLVEDWLVARNEQKALTTPT